MISARLDAPVAYAGTDSAGRIRLVDSIELFDQLQSSWEKLTSAQSDPLAGFAYARAWAGTLRPSLSLNVFVYETDRILGIAPLVKQHGGSGWLTQLAAETFEILDFLYATGAAARALADAIGQSGYPLFLNRIASDSPVVAAINEAYQGHGWVFQKNGVGAPFIPLDDSWREPEKHLNPGRRSDLRRARRHAAEKGEVQFEILKPQAAALPHYMEEIFRVEAAGWKGATGTALAVDPLRRSFYEQYAVRAQLQGMLRVCFLRVGGHAAAAQLAVETRDRFSLLKVGYDEQFSRCSPGILLTVATIRYAAERGLTCYDFNGKTEPWTELWTQHQRPCCSIRAYPKSARGVAALGADGCAATWRKAKR